MTKSIITLIFTFLALDCRLNIDAEKVLESFTPTPTIWILENDTSGYKNERYLDLQLSALRDYGIKEWQLKIMIAWFTQENGSLSENFVSRNYPNEKSYGLCQCNPDYRVCAPKGDYVLQKDQCLKWFADYTKDSTTSTIYRDIRIQHNSRHRTYEWEIKEKEKLFVINKKT